jgi:bis(5'-nucleosyl)-tetraphosphatase (symmetrical)
MATYAIGDVQGCYSALQQLLDKINFDRANDRLWFAGDIVNRGPESLKTLRFIKELGDDHVCVLGNHDLHLLAANHAGPRASDTFADILAAEDKSALLNWLRHRPLFHYDANLNYALVHAGVAAQWTLTQAQQLANEVESVLRETVSSQTFLQHMYGNQPDHWQDKLAGMDRLRIITNYFTRVRFCYADGRMDFSYKGPLDEHPAKLMPWFDVPERKTAAVPILFGHWAALAGETHSPHVHALDTGCVWGVALTAMRLEDQVRFQIKCC